MAFALAIEVCRDYTTRGKMMRVCAAADQDPQARQEMAMGKGR